MINETIEKRQIKFKEALIEALKEMPIIQVAVKKAGVSRDTYYRWKREDKNFLRQSEDALSQGIEFINDMSESQLVTLIRDKKMPAIALWLKTNHPRYGSKSRQYIPIASAEELTPDEEKMVLEALKLASGKKYENKSNSRIYSKNLGQ